MVKSRLCLAVVSLLVCLGHAAVASAQDPTYTWTTLGPYGAYVKALAIDPTTTPATLYAGMVADTYHSASGVYKSSDGGASWNPVNNGLPDILGVFVLAIDPVAHTLYAGLNGYYDGGAGGGGLFESINGGDSWIDASSGLPPNIGIQALAIDATTTPSTVYAGTIGTDVEGVFKSIDGGVTWRDANGGLLQNLSIFSIAIDPVTSSTLYAGAYDAGAYAGAVFKSVDGGRTWGAANAGLPTDAAVFTTLAIDPLNSSTLYAGKGNIWGGAGGVFKSVDGGGTWSDVTSGLPTDGSIHALAINPVTTSTVYAGSFGGGVFISTDSGSSWSDFNNGLTDTQIHAIAVNPLNPITAYTATCSNGVFVLGSS
jgi:hypothetical protein